MPSQKFWTETRELNVLTKLRNDITLDAFCTRVGENNGSMVFYPLQVNGKAFRSYIGAGFSLASAFTIELWFKTSTYATTNRALFTDMALTGFIPVVEFGLLQGRFYCSVSKGGIISTFTSAGRYPQGSWAHVAVTFDGTTVRFYINGVLDTNALTIAAPLDSSSGGTYYSIYGSNIASTRPFVGRIAESRVWTVSHSQFQINYNKDKRKGKNVGLSRYVRFNEKALGTANTPVADYLNGFTENVSSSLLDSEDFPTLITGASTLGAIFEVVAGQNISLKYPIKKPEDVEFTLCVAYIDEDTDTYVRYKLWDDVLDIAPKPIRYRGQVLPSEFRFEVWGRDGAEHAELLEDLIIYFSKTSRPTTSRDTTNVYLLDDPIDPVINNTLAVPWGTLFPLTFDIQSQYGMCDSPVTQDLEVMGDDIPVYGGNAGAEPEVVGFINEDGGPAMNEDGGRQIEE